MAASLSDEDIVFFDGTGFSLYFDGSNVGLAGLNLNAFTLPDTGGILLSFSAAASIPGIGTVDDSDIVLFTATSLGNVTAGSFSLYFDGSDVGLTRKQEGIDGIAVLANGNIWISTIGNPSVPGVRARDEDLLEFTPTALGSATAGSWNWYLDGSDVSLSSSSEAVYAGSISRLAAPLTSAD